MQLGFARRPYTSGWITIKQSSSTFLRRLSGRFREIIERAGLHVRLTRAHHNKLAMLVRETGRSRRDIIEMLIDKSKVAAYTE